MLFRQIIQDDLGCASYLIGDNRAGVAAVVDPRFEIDEYLELARFFGVVIEHVLETHNHADHVSGHGRLAAATGATIHVHRRGECGLPARAIRGWLGAHPGFARGSCHSHPGPPSRAHGICSHRYQPRRRAVGDADRRHALRWRRGAPGSGGRQAGGSAETSFAASTKGCSRSRTRPRSGPVISAGRCAGDRGWT